MSMETHFIRATESPAGSTDSLPADLTQVILKRIVFLALTPPVLVHLGNVTNFLSSYFSEYSFDYTLSEGVHDLLITVISLAVAWVVHRRLFSSRSLIRMGLAYCVFTAAWFGAVESLVAAQYQSPSVQTGVSFFSFSLIWVVFFPSIVPMRTTTAMVTILLAAGSALFMRWLAQDLGWVRFTEGSLNFLSIAMLFAVSMGVAVSNVVYKLGRSVSEAREMGSYHLEKSLGSGGMGEVWVASHRLLARSAAVKLIKPDVVAGMSPADLQRLNHRFEQEVQATATLQSPHTVDIYDYGITPEGTFYYVMELLDGIDVETLVERFGPVAPERVTFLLIQVCHSLHEAHRRQLVHRDIKPANLFVCEYGEDFDFVKVLDFGLVKHEARSDDGDAKLTREGDITGTPAYMCPEAITGTSPIDQRSDIYSLGCVAYWMLTGELVFEGETPMAVLTEHAKAEPIPPSRRTELEIPEVLDEIVLACLAKRPDDRPQRAKDLAQRLESVEFTRPWDGDRARAWWELHRVS